MTELTPPGDHLPLGVRPDGEYKDVEVDLRPGDVLLFASDGLPEAPAHALTPALMAPVAPPEKLAELFGFDRLEQCAAYWACQTESAEAVAAGLWADITAWCGPESHHDDMTLLVLRVP